MVADGVHILLGVALIALILRTDHVEAYLIGVLAAGVPDLDIYLFAPFIYGGYLSGPIWTHRGITHSFLALLLFVGAARLVGHWRPAAIGYGSHLAADFLTGGIRLLAPFSIRQHGLYYDWGLGNVVAGGFAAVVIFAELAVRLGEEDDLANSERAPGSVAHKAVGRLRSWFQ